MEHFRNLDLLLMGHCPRVYDAAGTLTGELWKQANGDEVSRTFYEQVR